MRTTTSLWRCLLLVLTLYWDWIFYRADWRHLKCLIQSHCTDWMFNSDNQWESWVVMQNCVTYLLTDRRTQPFIVKDWLLAGTDNILIFKNATDSPPFGAGGDRACLAAWCGHCGERWECLGTRTFPAWSERGSNPDTGYRGLAWACSDVRELGIPASWNESGSPPPCATAARLPPQADMAGDPRNRNFWVGAWSNYHRIRHPHLSRVQSPSLSKWNHSFLVPDSQASFHSVLLHLDHPRC